MFGRVLLLPTDLHYFRMKYEAASGGKISTDYLEKSFVRGFYNRRGEMIGGYIVNTKPSFRYLEYIPDIEVKKIPLKPNTDRIAEVTCIWIERKKIDLSQRYQIYTQLIADCLKSGADYILGGAVVEKVKNIQFQILNQPLWEGVSTQSQYQWIYFGKRDELVLNYVKALGRHVKGLYYDRINWWTVRSTTRDKNQM